MATARRILYTNEATKTIEQKAFCFGVTSATKRYRTMPPVRSRTVLEKLDKLKARARGKLKEKHAPRTIQDELKPSVVDAVNPVSTAERDGLWECLHLPLGSISAPVSVGAATTAGVELHVEDGREPLRSRKNNQDAFGVTPFFAGARDAVLAAVYDGHGTHGGEVSRLVRDVVPAVVEGALEAHAERCGGLVRERLGEEERRRAYVRVLNKAFLEAEKDVSDDGRELMHEYSGTTATCVWVDGDDVFVAWVGDSRCVMGKDGEVVELTWDQKPSREDEKKRVRAAGGRVTRWKKGVGPQRVWLPDEWVPGLAMTRSIGDTVLTGFGVVARPEVTVTKLGGGECFLVAASDGVWEFMSSGEVVEFVGKRKREGGCAEDAARELVNEAVRRWTVNETVVDDTTAVVIYIEGGRESGGKERLKMGREGGRGIGVPWSVLTSGRLERFEPSHEMEEDETNTLTGG